MNKFIAVERIDWTGVLYDAARRTHTQRDREDAGKTHTAGSSTDKVRHWRAAIDKSRTMSEPQQRSNWYAFALHIGECIPFV